MCLQVHVPLATCTVVLRSTCVGSIDGYICFKYSCTCTISTDKCTIGTDLALVSVQNVP